MHFSLTEEQPLIRASGTLRGTAAQHRERIATLVGLGDSAA